jgi:hypothetical protein
MSDILVCTTFEQAASVRRLLSAACSALDVNASLDLFGSGSLYQRLRARRSPPFPDLVVWSGPFAAQAAANAGLLEQHQPRELPSLAWHHSEWHWTAVEFQLIRAVGEPPVSTLDELAAVPRLALPEPERSEAGASMLLATIDRARQVEGDPERAWAWWAGRVRSGIRVADEDGLAADLVRQGRATHALSLGDAGSPVVDLAPLPNALSLAANAPNADAARRVLDWLTGPQAAAITGQPSAWRAEANGLSALFAVAPPLDVDWTTQQYTHARRRWAQAGFGPQLASP